MCKVQYTHDKRRKNEKLREREREKGRTRAKYTLKWNKKEKYSRVQGRTRQLPGKKERERERERNEIYSTFILINCLLASRDKFFFSTKLWLTCDFTDTFRKVFFFSIKYQTV